MLLLDALALECGQRAQPQVEDRLGLDLGQLELLLESGAGLVRILRLADQLDDGVEVVERLQIALEDVCPGLRLA